MVLIWAIFQGVISPRYPEEVGVRVSQAAADTSTGRLYIAKPFGHGPGVQKEALVFG